MAVRAFCGELVAGASQWDRVIEAMGGLGSLLFCSVKIGKS